VVVALTDGKTAARVWKECYFWCFPYYVSAAPLAAVFNYLEQSLGWQTLVMLLPVVYFVYRSYRLYLDRLENEKAHAVEVADLHLRTIEALALAIEAKDQTTHDHLQRVSVYAIEIAKEMKLPEVEIEALRAAALLHDIGKLAVPEHIISKPGKLTPEEFEKMKIHPQVGAQILERVQFPYPVAPIVLSHHEKWNGTGYPFGTKGEAIPLGARILSVVDCLDALASDRQYRRALSLEAAVAVVESESGKSYDPAVVAVLKRRYRDLEELTQTGAPVTPVGKLETNVRVKPGDAPGAGLQSDSGVPSLAGAAPADFLQSIAAAREEAQAFFELSQSLGTSLSLQETFSVMAARLRRLVPYDSVALYVLANSVLKPAFVSGADYALFSSLQIPIGQGLSGWVAEHKKAIINGNPSVEPGYLNDPTKFSSLNSALAVPLVGATGVVGVLAVYQYATDAFSRDQLRIVLAIASKLSVSIENALKYEQAECSATTDYLTGLPNARSLFVHLEQEVSRGERSGDWVTVLVCDLDGFKQVNDEFGHLTGNKVLSLVAARMRDTCRSYDYVARMGGDEFVLVLPGLARDVLPEKVYTLTKIVEEIGLDICGRQMLSLSIGAAAFPADGTTSEDLLAEADRRMYKNKSTKREAISRKHLIESLKADQADLSEPGRRLRLVKPA
jgi:diguanylate cyclase (GGDEF)-like protein/putative nucleotidyltransferase with HDIG domain